jgi:hypothetical protein
MDPAMRTLRTLLAAVLVLSGAFAAMSPAVAGGSRVSVGVGFGFGGWGHPYYGGYGWGPYPYYYPPYYSAPVVVQQQPTVYVEQPVPQQVQQPAGYWYYCHDARAYYPYVRECPAGWQRVAPQPSN